jgi:predicted metalloprotease with PDZ domain
VSYFDRRAGSCTLAALCTLLGVVAGIAAEAPYRCNLDVQVCLNQLVSNLKKRGWIGIEYEPVDLSKGLKVTRVVPGSPAEAAGLSAGDLITASDGLRFAAPADREKLEQRRSQMPPGTSVQYTIQRGGKERVVTITLGSLPTDVMAQMIGLHMLDHAQSEETN